MDSYISISQMAELHGITRQTLIYYDNIDLFKPAKVDDNGYRYYSKQQIPYLREICFLRHLDISIKNILEHFKKRSPENELFRLEKQKQYIQEEIMKFNKINKYLTQRMELYKEAVDSSKLKLGSPFLHYLKPRKAIFAEYVKPINKENLHITLMKLWNLNFAHESIPSSSFGSILKKDGVIAGRYLEGAGSCIFLPDMDDYQGCNVVNIPGGDYICMYKYGMPYEVEYIEKLVNYLKENQYELTNDIIDICLLDTTFYDKQKKVDFCLLQAPVSKEQRSQS